MNRSTNLIFCNIEDIDLVPTPRIEKLAKTQKFLKSRISPEMRVLDMGGVKGYHDELCATVYPSNPWILNSSGNAIEGLPRSIVGDARDTGFENESWDIVIALDIIEHLEEPSDLIIEARRILVKDGLLAIGTPNLACLYNRIILPLGLSPYGYSPSKYRVASPFAKVELDDSGHKSVFTSFALRRFVQTLGFDILYVSGYTYASETEFYIRSKKEEGQHLEGVMKFIAIRKILNKILPAGMREGTLIVCRKKSD